MKKIFILIFTLISLNCFAVEKSTTFTKEVFDKAQSEGKIVVINSWNKFCTTCKKQVNILDQAEKEFKDILFLSFEQKKAKEIANAGDCIVAFGSLYIAAEFVELIKNIKPEYYIYE